MSRALSELAAKCLAGGGFVLLSMALVSSAAVARTFVVAHYVGAHQLGLVAVALLTVATLEALSATGVEAALVSEGGEQADIDAAFTIQALRGLIVTLAVWTLAPLAAAFFEDPAAQPVIRAASVLALLRGLAHPGVALARKRLEFARIFWWSVPEVLTGLGLAVPLALVLRDVWAPLIAAIGAQLAATLASHAMTPQRPRLSLSGAAARRLIRFGRWVSGAQILTFLTTNVDNVVVGKLLGTSALGIYQLAFRCAELAVVSFTRAAAQVALPALSGLRGSPEQFRSAYGAVLRVAIGINCAFAAAVLLSSPALVGRLLGSEWLAAVPLMRILVVAMVFRGIVILSSEMFQAIGRPQLSLEVNAVRLGIILATILPLLQAFGMEGVAASVLLGGLVASVVCVIRTRGLLGLRLEPGLPVPSAIKTR